MVNLGLIMDRNLRIDSVFILSTIINSTFSLYSFSSRKEPLKFLSIYRQQALPILRIRDIVESSNNCTCFKEMLPSFASGYEITGDGQLVSIICCGRDLIEYHKSGGVCFHSSDRVTLSVKRCQGDLNGKRVGLRSVSVH